MREKKPWESEWVDVSWFINEQIVLRSVHDRRHLYICLNSLKTLKLLLVKSVNVDCKMTNGQRLWKTLVEIDSFRILLATYIFKISQALQNLRDRTEEHFVPNSLHFDEFIRQFVLLG